MKYIRGDNTAVTVLIKIYNGLNRGMCYSTELYSGQTHYNMYTYILKSHDLYKIGKANNVQNRLRSIKTGNPYVELIQTINGNYEKYLHHKYKEKRIIGEWFSLSTADLAYIIQENMPENEDVVTTQYSKRQPNEECPCEKRYLSAMIALKLSGTVSKGYIVDDSAPYGYEIWYNEGILDSCYTRDATFKKITLEYNNEDDDGLKQLLTEYLGHRQSY